MTASGGSLHDGFSDAELPEPVSAPFRGFRAFTIETDGPPMWSGHPNHGVGALCGVYKRQYAWTPGVNTASCIVPPGYFARGAGMSPRLPPHTRPIRACDCGFWAYTNGEHYLAIGQPAALGVIEAWGRVIIGPHGFRAEKARILGLCFPKPEDIPLEPPPAALAANMSTMPSIIDGVRDLWRQALAFAGQWLANASVAAGGPPMLPALANVTRMMSQPWSEVPEELQQRVINRYGVPVYDSVATLQRAFPLSDLTGLLSPPEEGE